ncbi:9829_t:CDS:1, partial [Diversispora eburnea]
NINGDQFDNNDQLDRLEKLIVNITERLIKLEQIMLQNNNIEQDESQPLQQWTYAKNDEDENVNIEKLKNINEEKNSTNKFQRLKDFL